MKLVIKGREFMGVIDSKLLQTIFFESLKFTVPLEANPDSRDFTPHVFSAQHSMSLSQALLEGVGHSVIYKKRKAEELTPQRKSLPGKRREVQGSEFRS